jgi:transcription-repair coupling factor (superfamily II helicase)
VAQKLGVETVERRGGALNLKFHPGSAVEPEKLMRLVGETAGAQFTPAGILRLPVPAGEEVLEVLRSKLAAMQ